MLQGFLCQAQKKTFSLCCKASSVQLSNAELNEKAREYSRYLPTYTCQHDYWSKKEGLLEFNSKKILVTRSSTLT